LNDRFGRKPDSFGLLRRPPVLARSMSPAYAAANFDGTSASFDEPFRESSAIPEPMEAQMTIAVIPRLLTTKEAADLLNVSVSFVMKARLRGDGPRYRKVGRSVRYFEADVLDWLKARARTSTSEN
jgi:excisionase family DNA binding protein